MNILTTGRLGEDFYNSLVKNDLGLNVRFVDKLYQKDIEWADALASFATNDDINLSSINWIHSFGAGVEGFIKRNDLSTNLILSRTVGSLGLKMGEYCLCHILNYSQNTYKIISNQSKKNWLPIYPTSIRDNVALLLGTGEMSRGISKLLKNAGIKTIGTNTSGKQIADFDHCVSFNNLKLITSQVNFVINTLPITKNTIKVIDKPFFNLFKNVLFINVGRGKTVNIDDLKIALQYGNCDFAVLDVFDEEPLPTDSSLWVNQNILITPHQAAITDVNDILQSFESALNSIKQKEDNKLFVSIKRGY